MGKKFLRYGILVVLAAAVCFILYRSCNESEGERIYRAAVSAVERSSNYPNPVFADYDEKYIRLTGKEVYQVEVHVRTMNTYLMEKEYVFDVTVCRAEDDSFIAQRCELRMEGEK